MKRISKIGIIYLTGIMLSLFIFSCNNVNNTNDTNNVIENTNNENKDIVNDKNSRLNNNYVFGSCSMYVPKDFEEKSKTPESVIFLVDRIPVIMNKVLIGDDFTNEKAEEIMKNLYQSFVKRFSKLTNQEVEEASFNNTKGFMCKYNGVVQNNDCLQESYIMSDEIAKSIYVFTLFCIDSAENDNVVKEFENLLRSLKRNN